MVHFNEIPGLTRNPPANIILACRFRIRPGMTYEIRVQLPDESSSPFLQMQLSCQYSYWLNYL